MSDFDVIKNEPLDSGETNSAMAGAAYQDWAAKPHQLVFTFESPSDFQQLEQKLREARLHLTHEGLVQAPDKAKIEVLLHGLITMASNPDYVEGYHGAQSAPTNTDTPTSEHRA